MTPPEVNDMRRRGAQILLGASWLTTLLLALTSALLGSGRAMPILLVGLAVNILPTILVMRGRIDRVARLCLGTLAAVQPALGVYALGGHPWQMDAHMYFFVALGGLTILCDWRPIVLAAGLIAAHHLILQYAVPEWVFTGSGNLSRVLFHAVAVIMQSAMLVYLSILMRRLMQRQADARVKSEQATELAEAQRDRAEQAMADSMRAAATAAAERARRAEVQAEADGIRRDYMRQMSQAFSESMSGIVAAVGTAAAELQALGRTLLDMASRSSAGATQTASSAAQASASADDLAARLHDLSMSITAIAASADQQARRSDDATSISAAGRDAVRELTEQSHTITGFADSIHDIAARTNLLALNATIEAARAGEVGRGFAIVASEVKTLAGQAASATSQIRRLAGSVDQGADVAEGAIGEITAMVADLATAAESIRMAVDQQRETASVINLTARETARAAEAIAYDVQNSADMANETLLISDRIAAAAGKLAGTARDLDAATQNFVARISTN